MNAEGLLEHYARIADAPDAVARLRQFILNLAVRGKLVPHAPAECPATRFGKDASKIVAGPFEIPKSWTWSRLSALGVLAGGGTPSKGQEEFWDGTIPWVSPKDMKVDYIADAQLRVTSDAIAKSAVRIVDEGSILFVVRGMILSHSFPVAVARVPLTINQDMKALTLADPGAREYVFRALKALKAEMLSRVLRSSHGTCRLEREAYCDFLLPIPPLAEQHRIVAKVDELMALCDRLEAARVRREATRDRLAVASLARLNAPDPETFAADARSALAALPALTTRADQIKQLRQTILNLAAQGKLVPQEAREKPGRLKSTDSHQLSQPLPSNWLYLPLAELLSEGTRNGYSRKPDEATDGVPILRISAGTTRTDGLVAEEEHKLISGIDEATRLQYGVEAGDLLACRFNGNKHFVGRFALFRDYLGIRPIFPDKLIRIRPARNLVVPEFLRFVAGSDPVRSAIEAACATTVGNWGISASNLKDISFPLPPLAEQHRIVAKVDALMALCDRLEASLTAAAATRRRLLDALLAEVFAPAADRLLEAAE